MRCPFCDADQDKVIDSRASDGGRVIRRRRECLKCSRRFTTYERIEETVRLMVIKKDGSRVPYDRSKLLRGIQQACYKRPVTADQLTQAVEQIEDDIYRAFDREAESAEIGRIVSAHLQRLDQVAYVRFASVYKDFRDAEDFLDEVRQVIATSKLQGPGQGKLFK